MRRTLPVLLAGLAMLGPFSIDAYLPAFPGMARDLRVTPEEVQHTLAAYLAGFAFMNLFHGALADSFGRRPVVLWGMVGFMAASCGCALAQTLDQLVLLRALQGMSTGAGIVVSRAVVRDLFAPGQAQKVMSQVTAYFSVAPVLAPLIGGLLFVALGWHSIFWFLTALGLALWTGTFALLPETLPATQRQPFNVRNLLQGYGQLGSSGRFLLLALACSLPFNGMFLYVLAAPAFLGTHLNLAPTQFFWFFLCLLAGTVCGSWVSGRLAGKVPHRRQVMLGLAVTLLVSFANMVAALAFTPGAGWAIVALGLLALGSALTVPVVTLLVLDIFPQRRGLASSLLSTVNSTLNAVIAGWVVPGVMGSLRGLAIASVVLVCAGVAAWLAASAD